MPLTMAADVSAPAADADSGERAVDATQFF
jgi:hypothetical protein